MIQRVTPVIQAEGLPLTVLPFHRLNRDDGGAMQDIGKVLRRKRAQYAQLGKEIELLQSAEETLREVAPLLADSDEEDDESSLLAEVDEEISQSANPAAKAASASASNSTAVNQTSSGPAEASKSRPAALRWP